MESGPGLGVAFVFAVGLVLWGLGSARLTRWNVTAPLAFVVWGVLAVGVLGISDVTAGSHVVREIAEFALALVLFSDAARVNVHSLRRDAGVPARLLGIGLPLTIGLGIAAALLCFTDVDPWVAAVIGAALAPTDAALGSVVVEDARVPARIRRALNVESGLNDGLATPIVTFFIVGAVEATQAVVHQHAGEAAVDLAVGAGVGVAVGVIGGWLLGRERRTGWAGESFVPVAVLGLAVLSFTGARELGVNGFVAAFVGGLAFGAVNRDTPERAARSMAFVALGGELLSLLLWFLFGAFLLDVLDAAPTGIVVYAILSLTLVRMVPVAIACIGSRLHASTVAFMGWFGPRGLASVVFGLLAFDDLGAHHQGDVVLGAVAATVLASVVLHGVTAGPLAALLPPGGGPRRRPPRAPRRPDAPHPTHRLTHAVPGMRRSEAHRGSWGYWGSSTSAAAARALTAAGTPAYTAVCISISTSSSFVQPTLSAPRRCALSSSVLPSAASCDTVTRLRCFTGSCSRAQNMPNANCCTIGKKSGASRAAGNPPPPPPVIGPHSCSCTAFPAAASSSRVSLTGPPRCGRASPSSPRGSSASTRRTAAA